MHIYYTKQCFNPFSFNYIIAFLVLFIPNIFYDLQDECVLLQSCPHS